MHIFDAINKDVTIQCITIKIFELFEDNFFETYFEENETKIVDYWEGDLCAIGLKKDNKVVYISTWDFRFYKPDKMKYYVDFETININTLETLEVVKNLDKINEEILLNEVVSFFKNYNGSNQLSSTFI
ncbi:MAG: hypothetical protein ACOVSR_10755 [Bacteroidia bacterium]